MPVPPVRAEAYTFFVTLTSQADTDIFQVNPTLAIGDVTVSTDGGALGNITTLPVVTPAGGAQVQVDLSIAEMTGDVIGVVFCDAAGAEWQDLYIEIFTDTQEIGDIPTAAAIAVAVWAAGARTLTSFGTLVADVATAVWGATTRTLSSFGTLVASIWSYVTREITGGGGSASDVWGYANRTLTQSASQVAAAVSGSVVTVASYTTWTIALTGLGDISARTKLYFTAKRDYANDADSASIVHVEETAGLLYVDGAVAPTAGNGSITVDNEDTGAITVVVRVAETDIAVVTGRYGVKMVTDSGVQYLTEGEFVIETPVPRAIS